MDRTIVDAIIYCGMLLIYDKKNELLRGADSETSNMFETVRSNLIYGANPIGQ